MTRLSSYLSTDLTLQVFASFLRSHSDYRQYFQVCRDCHGQSQFIKAETLFHYEHSSNYRVADETFEKLLADVSDEDFVPYELPNRIRCDELEKLIATGNADVRTAAGKSTLVEFLKPVVPDSEQFVDKLADFIYTEAKLPALDKNFLPCDPIEISPQQSREQIIQYLQQKRKSNTTADLAFYVYRDMDSCDWVPFIMAALQRNPVSVKAVGSMSLDEVYAWLNQMTNESIYDGSRLAQPDEVVNYKTGDGLEKAFLIANVIRQRKPEQAVTITVNNEQVVVHAQRDYRFVSAKNLKKRFQIDTKGNISLGKS